MIEVGQIYQSVGNGNCYRIDSVDTYVAYRSLSDGTAGRVSNGAHCIFLDPNYYTLENGTKMTDKTMTHAEVVALVMRGAEQQGLCREGTIDFLRDEGIDLPKRTFEVTISFTVEIDSLDEDSNPSDLDDLRIDRIDRDGDAVTDSGEYITSNVTVREV